MFLNLPKDTHTLWTRIDEAIKQMPEEDKDLFFLDLMKFCADWQFAYLQMMSLDEDMPNMPSSSSPSFSSEDWLT